MKFEKHTVQLPLYWPRLKGNRRNLVHWLLPTPGNVLFTLLVVAGLFWASNAGALPLRAPALAGDSTTTISYQGRLADSSGNPVTTSGVGMQFRLYNTDTGGAPLWEESHTAVPVEDGLFHVLLGSTNPIPVSLLANNSTLWLGIAVGADSEMTPREQIASVPYAMIASTVPDGSVTAAKIADGAVTSAKLNVDAGISVNGNLIASGAIGLGTTDPVGALHISRPGITGSSLRLANTLPGGGKWNIYTGDSGCFGDTLGIGPIVSPGSGHCGGDQGTAVQIGRNGDVYVVGSLSSGGTKSAVVQAGNYGHHKLYAVEAPDVRFSDEGMACLLGGTARVDLDPIFLETIEGEYLVHVTPYGNASLYVAEIGKDYFVVKARDGNPNIAFAWRLSAHRKGYARVRLEKVGSEQPEVAPAAGQP